MRYLYSFEDEADTMTIGWLVSRGYRLYADVFANHMPVNYFLAAFVTRLVPDGDYGYYRLVPWFCWVLVALSLVYSPALTRARAKAWLAGAFFLAAISLNAHHWWGHMILPDGIWASFFACFFALYGLPALTDEAPGRWASTLGGAAFSLAVLTSHVAVIAGLALVPFLALNIRRQGVENALRSGLACSAGIFAGTLIVFFGIYLFGDLRGFWLEAIDFNFTAYSRWVFAVLGDQPNLFIGMLQGSIKQLTFLSSVRPFYFVCLFLLAGALADWRRTVMAWTIGLGPVLVICFGTVMRIGLRDVFVHDAPFFTLATFGGAFALARLPLGTVKPWFWKLAFVYFLVGAIEISKHGDKTWYHGQDPTEWMADLKPFAAYVREHSVATDKISALNNAPIFYLLANREPAQNSISYVPWVADWEETRGWGSTACEQAEGQKAKFILLGSGYGWESCFYGLANGGKYKKVMKTGVLELWERKT